MQSRDTVPRRIETGDESSRVESSEGWGGEDEERKWENRMKMGEHRRGVEAGTIYRGREGTVIGSK